MYIYSFSPFLCCWKKNTNEKAPFLPTINFIYCLTFLGSIVLFLAHFNSMIFHVSRRKLKPETSIPEYYFILFINQISGKDLFLCSWLFALMEPMEGPVRNYMYEKTDMYQFHFCS